VVPVVLRGYREILRREGFEAWPRLDGAPSLAKVGVVDEVPANLVLDSSFANAGP